MTTLIITAKGEVTLDEDILKHLGVRPGEKVVIDKLADGRVQLRAGPGEISAVFGALASQ